MAVFTELPVEVLHLIAQHCDQHSRCTLSATTRQLHSVCIEEIYRTVDLSVHNSLQLARNGPFDGDLGSDSPIVLELPLDFAERPRVSLDDEIWLRQQQLIHTIKNHPEYGSHVRQLHWSVLNAPVGQSEDHRPMVGTTAELPVAMKIWEQRGLQRLDSIGFDRVLWDTFLAFNKVTSVDIAWLRSLRETCLPPPLFTSATSVRLVGQASTRFVAAILENIIPENLVSLSTINLQEFADPVPSFPSHMTLHDIIHHMDQGPQDHVRSTTFAGPMHNHLRHLTNRCHKLSHLEIRTYAPWEHWERLSLDDTRYEEWATFIRSVRPTLRSLVFEQHRAERSRLWRTNRSHPFGQRGRPALWTLFNEHILPVLTDKQSEWPRLERVELAGFHELTRCFACLNPPDFSQWENPHLSFEVLDPGRGITNDTWAVRETHVALNEEEKKSIQERLGQGVQLSIRGGSRKFENSCRTGIPGFGPRRRREG
ncbi:hypothetical protein DIS24_g3872 [Lasiodiplodia hormozganensis]|uniref:F-box domain-containing protein n=1 Tax=Lasiodiplodia hormozganensis TaxID=869390 RepID=A0AA39YXW7_9PEZI|nr:hypothetical protein DIS24_g3872 [Lasiodiplodia hormozganensis]